MTIFDKRVLFPIFLILCILAIPVSVNGQDSIRLFTSIPSDSVVTRYLKENKINISGNNKVVLLKSGREKFEDLFEHIEKAQHFIHLKLKYSRCIKC